MYQKIFDLLRCPISQYRGLRNGSLSLSWEELAMKRFAIAVIAFAAFFCLAATCCPSKKASVIYVAFGDSITDSEASPKYPWYLKQWFGLSDDQVQNEGKSGETIALGLTRLGGIIDCDTYPNAEAFLLLEGGNDLIDWIQEVDPQVTISPKNILYPYKKDLALLLDKIEGNLFSASYLILDGGSDVVIGSYFHVLPFKSPCKLSPLDFLSAIQASHVNDYVDLLNERIYRVADMLGIVVADIAASGALYGDYDNFLNCNHPSGKGNEVVAGFFYQALLNSDYFPAGELVQ